MPNPWETEDNDSATIQIDPAKGLHWKKTDGAELTGAMAHRTQSPPDERPPGESIKDKARPRPVRG